MPWSLGMGTPSKIEEISLWSPAFFLSFLPAIACLLLLLGRGFINSHPPYMSVTVAVGYLPCQSRVFNGSPALRGIRQDGLARTWGLGQLPRPVNNRIEDQ